MARRPHGTGSVYYDAHRGRWVGTYEAGWTTRGTRRRRKVSGRTETEARRKLRDAIRKADTEQATTGARPTVKRWADAWLEITERHHRPSTWATNRSTINRWVIPTIGHKRLDLLTPGDIRAVTSAMLDAGLAPASARRAQVVLEKMLKDAIDEGHNVPQRALMVDGPAAGENDRDAIPLPDAAALLAAAKGLPDESRWVAAFLQGTRPAEARGLTWDLIDLDREIVGPDGGKVPDPMMDVSWQLKPLPYRVPYDRTSGFRVPTGYTARQVKGALHLVRPKTRLGQRIIPLVPWMVNSLRAWQEQAPPSPHGLVWPGSDGEPRTDREDRDAFRALQDAAGVRHPSGRYYALYEARHTTATLLREAGVDDQTITAIMGHASILSTKAYLHTSDARTRAAVEGLAERLGLGS